MVYCVSDFVLRFKDADVSGNMERGLIILVVLNMAGAAFGCSDAGRFV